MFFESALSNADINTFSKLDAQENVFYAFNFGVKNIRKIGHSEKRNYRLNTQIKYEQVHQDFEEVERFRSVEFYRDWNLRDVELDQMQHISSIDLAFLGEKKLILTIV